jgi:amino acid transporter
METATEVKSQTLSRNALGFGSVLLQSVTHMGPAVGLVLTVQYGVSLAGVAAPLALTIAFLIVLTLAIPLAQLARHHPSAGGYHTYISRTIGPRPAFLVAWIYFLYDPASTAVNLAIMGFFLEKTAKAELGIALPWWLIFIPSALVITLLTYRGVKLSAKIMAYLTLAEMAIVLALAITGLLRPGDGGIGFRSYLPAAAPSSNGLYLGVVFSIFAFTGFESVAPLAEESANPKRVLPRAIICSILIMGAFFVFSTWTVLIGWGLNHTGSFVASAENPVLVLAKKFWGTAWALLVLAVVNSIIGICIACTNAATRVFFSMGRNGSLPKVLGYVHPRFRTPTNAIWLQTLITLVFGLAVGFWIGPDQEFYFMGIAMTLGLIFVYTAGNLGVFLSFRKTLRAEFSFLLHAVFPLISTLALFWVGYKSIIPLPAAPVLYAPFVVVIWLGIGVALAYALKRAGKPLPGSADSL